MKFNINDNRLYNDAVVEHLVSPNNGGIFDNGEPSAIIIHYTAGASRRSSVRTIMNQSTKVSAHLVIGRDKKISQCLPFNVVGWHAGHSVYKGRHSFNKFSIGIEIDNAGALTPTNNGDYVSWFRRFYRANEVIKKKHRNEEKEAYWHTFTEWQIEQVREICKALIARYPIKEILGHDEISPGRKRDPGPAFPLNEMLVGDCVSGVVTATKLNVRSGPSKKEKIVSEPLIRGSIVRVTDKKNSWYCIDDLKSKWVHSRYIDCLRSKFI